MIPQKRRLVKNTLYLYIRMFLSMVLSLFVSRIVLKELGIIDYGIYGAVGGIVILFSFLNSSLSGATSRFITIELGSNNLNRLNRVFSVAFFEHLGIAALILVVSETLGLWIVNNYLVIPYDRLATANLVYQMSIITLILTVVEIPYRACIIAHEQMNVYAFIEIVRVVLKFGVAYLLIVATFDKLGLFSVLVLVLELIVLIIYIIYCFKKYIECHIKSIWDKELFKVMTVYSGWDLYGNMSLIARNQGVALILNIFFGPAMNAAFSVSSQAGNAVLSFASNVTVAVKPQIIKAYAQKDLTLMANLLHHAVRANLLILFYLTIPILLELHFLLDLWLHVVPGYSVIFCSLILILNLFASSSGIIVSAIHATGELKRMSLIVGTLNLSVIPISFIVFSIAPERPWIPFAINVVSVFLGLISNALIVSKKVGTFLLVDFFKYDLIRCMLVFLVTSLICAFLHFCLEEGFLRFILIGCTSTITLTYLGFIYILPPSAVSYVRKKVINCLHFNNFL